MTSVSPVRTRAWSSPSFRRLWAGSSASVLGAEIAEIALPMLALLTLSATAAEVSALRVAQFLPFILATLPVGLLVDRRHRERLRLMVTADLGRFLLVGSIPLLVWVGGASVPQLCATVFLAGVLTVLHQVADFALLPRIVSREQLVDANGKLQATASAGQVAGQGVGGLLVQLVTAPVAVVGNALGFLVSALCLRSIRLPGPGAGVVSADDTAPAASSALRDTWVGLHTALTHRHVRPLLGEATTFNAFHEVLVLGLLVWTVRDLGMPPGAVGLVFTAGGVGSLLAAWFGARLTGRWGYGRVLLVALLLGNGAPLALLTVDLVDVGGSQVILLLCGVYLVMGVGIGVANVHAITLRQLALPEHLAGRANAAYRLVSWGAIPVGAALGGAVATTRDSHAAVTVGAIGVALATAWVLFSSVPRLRHVEEAQPEVDG